MATSVPFFMTGKPPTSRCACDNHPGSMRRKPKPTLPLFCSDAAQHRAARKGPTRAPFFKSQRHPESRMRRSSVQRGAMLGVLAVSGLAAAARWRRRCGEQPQVKGCQAWGRSLAITPTLGEKVRPSTLSVARPVAAAHPMLRRRRVVPQPSDLSAASQKLASGMRRSADRPNWR